MKKIALLGNLSAHEFLRDYWQKKPLLIRSAVPDFKGIVSREEMLALACTEEAEARMVWRDADGWQLSHGPLRPQQLRRRGTWTVLLQGLNLLRDDASALLHEFDFIPHARLDDLMVSYATEGGGVGPHFDSYDVFLLQGMGKRHWRISAQRDLALEENAPLRILKNFKATREWTLEPGDMLYLPPHFAHDGIAIGDCMTYSIGFRAPSAQELAEQFLIHLQDQLAIPGQYRDPDLQPQRHAAEIGKSMLDQVEQILSKIRWNRNAVADFLGSYLSEPKPSVFFDPPQSPLDRSGFKRLATRTGLHLHRKSQLLFAGKQFFLNGEPWPVAKEDLPVMRDFADRRRLAAKPTLSTRAWELIYDAYCDGFIELSATE